MKKTLSLILCILVILSLSVIGAGAENGEVLLISGSKQTEYADYKEALKYADPGDTIQLLKDITLYGAESITISAGVPLTFDGNGHTINSPYTAFYIPAAAEGNRSSLTLKNLTLDATSASGKCGVQLKAYTDVTIENCTIRTSSDAVNTDNGIGSVVTIKNSVLESTARYGIKAYNHNTYVLENTSVKASAGSCVEVMAGDGNFCLWIHEAPHAVINGGTYTTGGNENKPAAI